MITAFLNKYKGFLTLGVSVVLFGLIIVEGESLSHFTFSNVVYLLLSFIVILEIVKMIEQYIIKNFIQLRLVIDTFFIFILRETILVYTNHDLSKDINVFSINNVMVTMNEKLFYIMLGIFVMGILMFFRTKAMNDSPNETNCKKCPSNKCCDYKGKDIVEEE